VVDTDELFVNLAHPSTLGSLAFQRIRYIILLWLQGRFSPVHLVC